MVYYKFIKTVTRNPDEDTACNEGRCPDLRIDILSGDRTDVDCRNRIYTTEQLASLPVIIVT